MITCPSCQQQIKEGLKFCPQCGLAMSSDAAVSTQPAPPQEIAPPSPLEDRTPNGSSDDSGLEVTKMEIPFEPLPEGAIIGGQYLIRQLLKSEQPNVHLYYTEDIRDAQTDFPFCVIKESATRGLLGMELPIARMNLIGDGNITLLRRFTAARRLFRKRIHPRGGGKSHQLGCFLGQRVSRTASTADSIWQCGCASHSVGWRPDILG